MRTEIPLTTTSVAFRVLFKVVPTIAIILYLLHLTDFFFAQVSANTFVLYTLFAATLLASYVMYLYRIRFSATFALLLGLMLLAYYSFETVALEEFDAFYYSLQWIIFGAIFLFCWVTGYGLARHVLYATGLGFAIFVFATVTFMLRQPDFSGLIWDYAPVLVYIAYIIYINEIIFKLSHLEGRDLPHLLGRTFLFVFIIVVVLFIIYVLYELFGKNILDKEQEERQNQKMDPLIMVTDPDGQRRFAMNNESAGVNSSFNPGEEVLFCAYIDDVHRESFWFFKDVEIPRPHHLRHTILTHYDPEEQRFVRDPSPPSAIKFDLFEFRPDTVRDYFSKRESQVHQHVPKNLRRAVSTEVFLKQLSKQTFVAPSVAYYGQLLPLELTATRKDTTRKVKFHTAYRCSSLVSDINQSYYVYNFRDDKLEAELREREARLKDVTQEDYHESPTDSLILDYYTRGFAGDTSITRMAQALTAGATTPYEKVQAVYDYFRAELPNGDPLFTVTYNPGGIRTAAKSQIEQFLVYTHRGYFMHFAGATMLLLRAAGVPCRMALGFATYDRGGKGWYWYYSDQTNAWVEIYWPGYGWLDFDTMPASTGQEPPQPDPVPPEIITRPLFTTVATIKSISKDEGRVTALAGRVVFRDNEIPLYSATEEELSFQAESADLPLVHQRGKAPLPLEYLTPGEVVLITTNDARLQNRQPPALAQDEARNQTLVQAWLKKLPHPMAVEKIQLLPRAQKPPEPKTNYGEILTKALLGLLWVLLFAVPALALLPVLIYAYYRLRTRSASTPLELAHFLARATEFLLNQCNIRRINLTLLGFAETVVDARFGTDFATLVRLQQKVRYSPHPLTPAEAGQLQSFKQTLHRPIVDQIELRNVALHFLNPVRSMRFFYISSRQ